MTKDMLIEMDETSKKLLQGISSIPEEKFNTIPFANSWTAAQVSDHILKSVSGALEMLYSTTKPAGRQPDEKKEVIKTMFLDFTTKMKSPEFVLPANLPIEKEKISTILKDVLHKLMEAIKTLNLSETCTAFEFPGFGELTRAEWIWFAIYHTQRHTHQLENIYKNMEERISKIKSTLN